MSPPLPTPEPIREAMKAAGWVLSLDLIDGRKRCELWAYSHRNVMKLGTIDLGSWRAPIVQGNYETIQAGFGILMSAPSKGIE